jgi:hypothetical protein
MSYFEVLAHIQYTLHLIWLVTIFSSPQFHISCLSFESEFFCSHSNLLQVRWVIRQGGTEA